MPKTEMILKFDFEASHTLTLYEKHHNHFWQLEIGLTGQVIHGMIIDLMLIRTEVEKLTQALHHIYLNDSPLLPEEAKKEPTCETMSLYFFNEIKTRLEPEFQKIAPSIQFIYAKVTLFSEDKVELGAVKRSI